MDAIKRENGGRNNNALLVTVLPTSQRTADTAKI
jgi:hypothetical protein